MQIHGLNKTTLLDYPGKLACTIFTGNCNFRCVFCQNESLVLDPGSQPTISEDEIFEHLKKRSGILQGVCITGGEPTLQADLPKFISKIKALGLPVKLDTNGYRPGVIRELVKSGLIDMVAMDIKAEPKGYAAITGIDDIDLDRICDSVDFLIHGDLPYEFRTTVVAEYFDADSARDIAEWLSGSKAYYLQGFRDSDSVIMPGLHACTKDEMLQYRAILAKTIDKVELRGVD